MSVTKNEIRAAMRARRKAVTPDARLTDVIFVEED